MLYLQRHSTDFRNLFLSSKMLSVGIGCKASDAQVLYFCIGKVKTLRTDNIWNFATFKMYIVPAKIPYVQRYSNDFGNLCLSSKMLRVGIWVKASSAQVFYFCNGKGKPCTSTTFEILQLSACSLFQQKILYLQSYSRDFRNLCLSTKMLRVGIGWKASDVKVFYFCIGKVKILRIDNIWNFATFNLYTVPEKILYLQRHSTDFRNICLSSKMLRVGIAWKASGVQVFYFRNGKVKTLQFDNIRNFATFNLYNVPAEILYLRRYSTAFRKLCFSSNMLRVGIWAESLWWAGILLLQWKGENFGRRLHLKFCHFQPVHCACKHPISPKVFNRFTQSLPQLEDVDGGHSGGKFQVRRYFTCAMPRWKRCASTTFEILTLSTCKLCQQKSYISKGVHTIFEIFGSPRTCWGFDLGGKFQVRTFLLLKWQGENFVREQHLKFGHFQPVHCARKNPIL